MFYSAYDIWNRSTAPLHAGSMSCAQLAKLAFDHMGNPLLLEIAAELEAVGLSRLTHTRPHFSLSQVTDAAGVCRDVEQSVVRSTPFANLIQFTGGGAISAPKILLVAPMSGHFSTLLNGTVNTLVQDHDVYLTDWKNPRDIPAAAGEFGFDEFVDHIIDFLKALGPETHLLAVCQPVVACLAAAAIMAEDNDHCQPASLILMAGPIDTRYSPTKVNYLAKENTIEWFEQNVIFTVPFPNLGVGRKVYPGFIQLLAFMSMNRNRHLKAFKQMREHRATGSHEKADTIAGFYREYFAVMDITSKFYLETIERVFQKHELPLKKLKVRDRRIDCSFIRKPFLLTIEGERDDICGIGQTLAAHDLCNRMPMYKKSHLLQAGVGHYGVFSGKRWERRTYPIVREFIRAAN